MTAKQELSEFVDHLSEAEATAWLRRIKRQSRPGAPPFATPAGRPDYAALLALDLPARHRAMREWEAEVDVDELRDLEGADIDLDLIDE